MKLSFIKRRLIRAEVLRYLREDREIREVISKCGRSAAKDWIEDQAEDQRIQLWTCSVCHSHDCDGPHIHGVHQIAGSS